jgi:outer membrane protein TolC
MHPALAARREAHRVAEKACLRSRRDYAPSLRAMGTWDWDSDASTDFEDSYFVGLVAHWDAFTGLRRRAAALRADAERDTAAAEEQATRNRLRQDLTDAVLDCAEARERVGVTEKSVDRAAEALRITGERYREGAADITELLTAQVGLTATRNRAVASHYDYLIALSNLARAQGKLGEHHD